MARNEDYYCGLIFAELEAGSLRESVLIKNLAKQTVKEEDVKRCLIIMKENGLISMEDRIGSFDPKWCLGCDLQSGDFCEDALPNDLSGNDLCEGFQSVSLESSQIDSTAAKSSSSLPPPAVKSRSTRGLPCQSNEQTILKTTPPSSSQHSMHMEPSLSSTSLPENVSNSMQDRNRNTSSPLSSRSLQEIRSSLPTELSQEFSSSENQPGSSSSQSPSQSCLLTRTIREGDGQSSRVQQRYMSQTQTGPGSQTISMGQLNIETTSAVNQYRNTEIDPKLEPILVKLKKIIAIFFNEPNVDLKPKDVAQKAGVGSSAKAVNKELYFLEKKKILLVKTNNGKDPKWNKNPTAKFSEKDLQEYAAELFHGSSSNSPGTVHVSHHHHNHHHEHQYYLQAGDNNVMHFNPEESREQEVAAASETIVNNLQQSPPT